jgi:hypothetical protein
MKDKITLVIWGIFFLLPANLFANLNSQEGMMFFSGYNSSGSGALYRCALDGSEMQEIYATSDNTAAVAVDMQNQKVYWTESYSVDLKRCNFDGSQVEFIADLAGSDVAVGGGKVYWSAADRIMKSNLDGTNQQTLLSGIQYPRSLAVDTVNNKLYFNQNTTNSQAVIWESGLDGSNPQVLTTEPYQVFSLAVDVENEKLFWYRYGGGGEMAIQQFTLSNLLKQTVWTGPYAAVGHLDVDLITDRIYWADQYVINSINCDGTDYRNIYSTGEHGPFGIAIAHVPEPATLFLLGLGAVILRKRKK